MRRQSKHGGPRQRGTPTATRRHADERGKKKEKGKRSHDEKNNACYCRFFPFCLLPCFFVSLLLLFLLYLLLWALGQDRARGQGTDRARALLKASASPPQLQLLLLHFTCTHGLGMVTPKACGPILQQGDGAPRGSFSNIQIDVENRPCLSRNAGAEPTVAAFARDRGRGGGPGDGSRPRQILFLLRTR